MKTLILLSVLIGIAFGGPLDLLSNLNQFTNQSDGEKSLDKKWCGCAVPKSFTSHEHKNNVPWEVYILENDANKILCSAIIINNKNLILAKDCLKGKSANQISVALKSNFLDPYDRIDNFKTIQVEEIIPLNRIGEMEDERVGDMGKLNINFNGQIAILRLKTPIDFSTKFFEPACINFKQNEMTDYENSNWITSAFKQKEDGIIEKKDVSLDRLDIDRNFGINFLVDFDNPLGNLKVGDILRSVNGEFTKVEGIYFFDRKEKGLDNKEFANYGRLSSFSESIKEIIGDDLCGQS